MDLCFGLRASSSKCLGGIRCFLARVMKALLKDEFCNRPLVPYLITEMAYYSQILTLTVFLSLRTVSVFLSTSASLTIFRQDVAIHNASDMYILTRAKSPTNPQIVAPGKRKHKHLIITEIPYWRVHYRALRYFVVMMNFPSSNIESSPSVNS